MGNLIIIAGVVAAIAVIFLLLKSNLRRVLGYDLSLDISFTGLLAWIFAGTFSGMFAALLGGAILSVFMFFAKILIGSEKYDFKSKQWKTITQGFLNKQRGNHNV